MANKPSVAPDMHVAMIDTSRLMSFTEARSTPNSFLDPQRCADSGPPLIVKNGSLDLNHDGQLDRVKSAPAKSPCPKRIAMKKEATNLQTGTPRNPTLLTNPVSVGVAYPASLSNVSQDAYNCPGTSRTKEQDVFSLVKECFHGEVQVSVTKTFIDLNGNQPVVERNQTMPDKVEYATTEVPAAPASTVSFCSLDHSDSLSDASTEEPDLAGGPCVSRSWDLDIFRIVKEDSNGELQASVKNTFIEINKPEPLGERNKSMPARIEYTPTANSEMVFEALEPSPAATLHCASDAVMCLMDRHSRESRHRKRCVHSGTVDVHGRKMPVKMFIVPVPSKPRSSEIDFRSPNARLKVSIRCDCDRVYQELVDSHLDNFVVEFSVGIQKPGINKEVVVKEAKMHTYRLSEDPVCTHEDLVFDAPERDTTWAVTARFIQD